MKQFTPLNPAKTGGENITHGFVPKAGNDGSNTQARPFSFVSYGGTGGEEKPGAAVLQEEYKRGHQEGLQAGLSQGKQETLHGIEQSISMLLAGIAPKLAAFFGDLESMRKEYAELTASLAFSVGKKIAGEALAANAESVIESAVRDGVTMMLREPELVVTVHPRMAEHLQARIGTLAKERGFEGKITVSGLADMPEHDCAISWKDGGMSRDAGLLTERVQKVLGVALKTTDNSGQAPQGG